MGAYDDRPYEVGKGKPPKDTQWRPGMSGNPKGRKPKVTNRDAGMAEILAEVMNERVPVVKDGKTTEIANKEVILRTLVRDAFMGTAAARGRAFDKLLRLGAFDLKPSERVRTKEEEEAAIMSVVEQLAEEARKSRARAIEFASTVIDPLWETDVLEERLRLGLSRRREPHEMANYTPDE